MPQSLAKILIHLVYSTKGRRPLLPHDPFPELHIYARGILVDQKCHMIEMNNVADHVHILFDLHRTKALADVVMHVKKGTSRWLKEKSPQFAGFDWQDGYGAFSLGQSQRPEAIQYLQDQQNHYRTVPFQDEFRKFLGAYEIEYDECRPPRAASLRSWPWAVLPGTFGAMDHRCGGRVSSRRDQAGQPGASERSE